MKNIYILILTTFIFSSGIFAQSFSTSTITYKNKKTFENKSPASSIFISHSLSQDIIGGTAACSASNLHADNSYIRVFDFTNDFGITTGIEIASIDFGIETSVAATGNQPVIVNIYTLSGALEFANLTLIATQTMSIPDQNLSIFNAPISASIPASCILVVEIFSPDGQTDGNSFFMGSNPNGQTNPSYISAVACGLNDITDVTTIGYAQNHYVINVNAEPTIPNVPLKSWPIILSMLLIGTFVVFKMK